jgi:hypothetical protein
VFQTLSRALMAVLHHRRSQRHLDLLLLETRRKIVAMVAPDRAFAVGEHGSRSPSAGRDGDGGGGKGGEVDGSQHSHLLMTGNRAH